ncbi:rhamnulokinase [Consotaella aegiceratis]|uniref:rhamnulokinase n=1 Tax=Consotaella aegiceratis TaxID=3097961 RepID=UPI002F3FD169
MTDITRCAAVDLGAGSGRVILAELTGGRLSLTELHRFDTPHRHDADSGHEIWDVDAIEAEIRIGLAEARARGALDSVGVDSWGVDFVLLDERRERVAPAVCYRDHRTDGIMDDVFQRMPADEIYRRTGIQFLPLNTLYQLAATARDHPDWLAKARHLLMMPDYFHFRLSGEIANEATIGSTTQLFDLATGAWDPGLLALAGIDGRMVRRPVPAGTPLGWLRTEDGASDTRVIAPASHDTAAAVAAAPLAGPDEAVISSGTWSLMGIESPVPYADATARRLNISNEGGAAGRTRVLKNLMGLWIVQRLREENGCPPHDALVEAAAAAPAWRSLIDPDHPRFLNPASMSAAIEAACAETGEPKPRDLAGTVRCAFDSLALDYRRVKEELETLRGQPLKAIRIVGGGSRNALLNQLCADACQVPVSAGPVETSALGNACLQMMALGRFASLEDIRTTVRRSFPVTDVTPGAPVPDAVWRRFCAIVETPAG